MTDGPPSRLRYRSGTYGMILLVAFLSTGMDLLPHSHSSPMASSEHLETDFSPTHLIRLEEDSRHSPCTVCFLNKVIGWGVLDQKVPLGFSDGSAAFPCFHGPFRSRHGDPARFTRGPPGSGLLI